MDASDGPAIARGDGHRFWELDGEPTLLSGGSRENDPFQIPDLKRPHTIAATGGLRTLDASHRGDRVAVLTR